MFTETQGLKKSLFIAEPGTYDVYWNEDKISNVVMTQGGVHTFVVNKADSTETGFLDFLLTSENSVHMFWIVPQYFVITVGEIMFSITALEFSYSQVNTIKSDICIIHKTNFHFLFQAPTSMKSVLQAVNLLTVAFGNLIVIIVAEAKLLDQVKI